MLQLDLFSKPAEPTEAAIGSMRGDNSTTFTDNLSLPVHRWFRYSAGFSAAWVASEIKRLGLTERNRVLDPFAGAGTTLVECEQRGVSSVGLDPHPFVSRVALAKLEWKTDVNAFRLKIRRILSLAEEIAPDLTASRSSYAPVILPKILVRWTRLGELSSGNTTIRRRRGFHGW